MGLGQSERKNRTYVTAMGDSFRLKVPEGTEGAVKRMNMNGQAVWELHYTQLDGYLAGLSLYDSGQGYGPQWNVTIDDGTGEQIIINLPYSGSHTKTLLNRLCSLTPDQINRELLIMRPFEFERKDKPGKKARGIALYLSNADDPNNKVVGKFTKDDLPPLQEVTIKGQKTFDDTDQMKFIQEHLENWIIPHVGNPHAQLKQDAENEAPEPLSRAEAMIADMTPAGNVKKAVEDDSVDIDVPF